MGLQVCTFKKMSIYLCFILCTYEYLVYNSVSASCTCNGCRGQKRLSGPMELELWMVIIEHQPLVLNAKSSLQHTDLYFTGC